MEVRRRQQQPTNAQSVDDSGQDHAKTEKTDYSSNVVSNPRVGSRADVKSWMQNQPAWVGLAVASGGCAALNGVFAKLTTTSLTSTLSSHLSSLLGLDVDNNAVNIGLRSGFFGLNLLFNGIMWGLFTAALTKGTSTTQVSIVNVSANFFLTAILGWLIFAEKLPLQWWLGAGMLAAGNIVIGMREEGEQVEKSHHSGQVDDKPTPNEAELDSKHLDVGADRMVDPIGVQQHKDQKKREGVYSQQTK